MLIFTAGSFGRAVGRRLADMHDARCADLVEHASSFGNIVRGADFVGVAVSRPYPALCQAIDVACFEQGIRWSMVQLHGDTLTCGPLVIPGRTACHHCFLSRAASHYTGAAWERALRAHYAAQPDDGPAGYPAALVEIGANALAGDARTQVARARVRSVDVLTSSVRESEVVGIHQCPRCRKRPAGYDPTERSVEHLVPSLENLLNG